MKKNIAILVVIACITILFTGCADKPAQPDQSDTATNVVIFENPPWQTVSIASEDYGIIYDETEMNYGQFPLDKLVAYYLNSDGVYAEGSSDELYRRFLEAPNIVLTYIALIGDDTTKNDVTARTELCWAISSADVFWYHTTDSFNSILEQYDTIYPFGSIADVLMCLKDEHESAIERNK